MVLKACCILRNMIADRRVYKEMLNFQSELVKKDRVSVRVIAEGQNRQECRHEKAAVWRETIDGLVDVCAHGELVRALMDHIWLSRGYLAIRDESMELSKNEIYWLYCRFLPASASSRGLGQDRASRVYWAESQSSPHLVDWELLQRSACMIHEERCRRSHNILKAAVFPCQASRLVEGVEASGVAVAPVKQQKKLFASLFAQCP